MTEGVFVCGVTHCVCGVWEAGSWELNPFPAVVQYTGPGARLSRDRLPSDSPIEATTPF